MSADTTSPPASRTPVAWPPSIRISSTGVPVRSVTPISPASATMSSMML